MSYSIYLGNLDFSTTADDLRALCEEFGTVSDVRIVRNRQTGQPRGFAFVEFESVPAAEAAKRTLDGTPFHGRDLVVNDAKPIASRQERRQDGRREHRNGSARVVRNDTLKMNETRIVVEMPTNWHPTEYYFKPPSSGEICQRCTVRPATLWWYGKYASVLELSHGFCRPDLYCERCSVEAQIEYAEAQAARLPDLRQRLAML